MIKRRKVRESNADTNTNNHRVRLNKEELEFLYAVRAGESSINIKQKIKQANEVALLKKEIKNAHNEIAELEACNEFLFDAKKGVVSAPKFTKKQCKTVGKHKTEGIPCLFLSDLHHGEVVNPDEIGGVNNFNMQISEARINNVVNKAISLTNNYFRNPQYSGAVMIFGGDMVSGNIHDELRETNGALIMDVVLDLTRILTEQIVKVRDVFGKVYIPCVVGNHGRLDKKPRAKGGVKDNFDWLIYKIVQQNFANDKRVTVDVSDGFDKRFDVFSHRFLLTHGNQFKAGNAIAGPVMGWKRGELKKKKNYENIGNAFDTMIMGHFHSLTYANGLIVNGSTKGMDEWCWSMNFEFERPQQALWIVNPDGNITYKMEVFAD